MVFILLILVSLISRWQWITNFSVLTYGDWGYLTSSTLKEFYALPSTWTSFGLGGINLGSSFYPFQLFFGIFSKIGFNYPLIERIVFLWPILIAFPIFSYLFVRKQTSTKLAAIIGSFVYSYSTYFLVLETGHLTLLVAYALFPLMLLYFENALDRRKLKLSIIAGLIGFIISFYEFRIFYISTFILFSFLAYYILIIRRNIKIGVIIKLLSLGVIPIVITILLNSYWIISFANTGSLSSNTAFDRSLFGNEFLNILYAMTLDHPFWTGSKSAIFVVQQIPIYFWLIPLMAILGLYLNRKNKNILFFGLLAVVGIFLTKQVAHPFSNVYPFLFKHLPGFNAFREASKFFSIIALAYSVLIASFVDYILKTRFYKNKKYFTYFFVFLIGLIFIFNLRPIASGEFGTLFSPRSIPEDNILLNDYVLSDENFSRVLWIPATSRWGAYTNNHPILSEADLLHNTWSHYIDNKRNDKISEGELMKDLISFKYSENLLSNSSIKFVVLPIEDINNDDDFFNYYGKPRSYYANFLNQTKYLKRIDIGTKDLVLFENLKFKPHVYITDVVESIIKENKYDSVNWKFINSSEYRIKINSVKNPIYINFTDSFHPGWKIRVGQFNWKNTLSSNYSVPEIYHTASDANLNSFYLDPKLICAKYKCMENNDGSFNIDATIYFKPQIFTYIGLIISMFTFVGLSLILIILVSKKK